MHKSADSEVQNTQREFSIHTLLHASMNLLSAHHRDREIVTTARSYRARITTATHVPFMQWELQNITVSHERELFVEICNWKSRKTSVKQPDRFDLWYKSKQTLNMAKDGKWCRTATTWSSPSNCSNYHVLSIENHWAMTLMCIAVYGFHATNNCTFHAPSWHSSHTCIMSSGARQVHHAWQQPLQHQEHWERLYTQHSSHKQL